MPFEIDLLALQTGLPQEPLIHETTFLDWPLLVGIVFTVAVAIWIVYQLRESKRLTWGQAVSRAIRSRDEVELERLRRKATRGPYHDILLDVIEAFRVDATRQAQLETERFAFWEQLQHMPLACVVTERGRIAAVNQVACGLLRRTERDLVGRVFNALFGPGPIAAAHAHAEALFKRPGVQTRLVGLRGKDSVVPALIAQRPLPHREEWPQTEVSILVDLSRWQPTPSRSGPDENLETMAHFAGCVAKDFNDLLTTILVQSSTLASQLPSDGASTSAVDEITAAAERARQVSHQLLAFSRQRLEGRDEPGAAAETAAPQTPALRAVSGDSPPPTICVVEDDVSVRRLIFGVLQREGYRVVSAGSAAEARQVIDQSPMPIDLFLTDVNLPDLDGISLYAEIRETLPDLPVLFMSGFLEEDVFHADSPGHQFLQKPFTPQELLTKVQAASLEGGAERRRILVVDDEVSSRTLLQALLKALDYDCLLAEDGEQALEMLRWMPIDAVISDMIMPNLDGLETCAAIRERHPGIRIIAMSGKSGGSSNLAAATKLGAVATLTKPFSKGDLLLTLQKAFAA